MRRTVVPAIASENEKDIKSVMSLYNSSLVRIQQNKLGNFSFSEFISEISCSRNGITYYPTPWLMESGGSKTILNASEPNIPNFLY